MTSILVIPDLVGDASVADWRQAAKTSAADGTIDVVGLPGHDDRAQPVGGEYDLVTPGYELAQQLTQNLHRRWDIVVGVGLGGLAANLAVFADRADSLALIDGLGDPWLTTTERTDQRRARMRAIEADPAALAHHHGGGRDPRLAHGVSAMGSRPMAIRIAAATRVPTLIIVDRGPCRRPGRRGRIPAGSPADDAVQRPSGVAGLDHRVVVGGCESRQMTVRIAGARRPAPTVG